MGRMNIRVTVPLVTKELSASTVSNEREGEWGRERVGDDDADEVVYSYVFILSLSLHATACICPSTECGKLDVALVIDESGSIGQDDWDNAVIPWAVGIANALPISVDLTRMACIRFWTEAEVFFNLDDLTDNAGVSHIE